MNKVTIESVIDNLKGEQKEFYKKHFKDKNINEGMYNASEVIIDSFLFSMIRLLYTNNILLEIKKSKKITFGTRNKAKKYYKQMNTLFKQYTKITKIFDNLLIEIKKIKLPETPNQRRYTGNQN